MAQKDLENPWEEMSQKGPEYVLGADKAVIDKINSKRNANHKIHLEILPEPYLGNPNANIVLLNLNPGFDTRDSRFHEDKEFKEAALGNLRHKEAKYPFFPLDPRFKESPVARWWTGRLRPLIEEFGVEVVAKSVFCVEFFPYHSIQYKHSKEILKTQEYNFHLVEKAIDRGAMIIMMRAEKYWTSHVNNLHKYYVLSNPQGSNVSFRNLLVKTDPAYIKNEIGLRIRK